MYERTGRREIVLDVDLSWSSDCDVSVGFKGLGAPAVLAVREVFLRGIVRWVQPKIPTCPDDAKYNQSLKILLRDTLIQTRTDGLTERKN